MARKTKPEHTDPEEAELLSSLHGPALDDDDGDFIDPEIAELNDPDVETLGDVPMIGGTPHTAEMFGEAAQSFGRPTSPKLWASASQFPTAVQFRVWRMENGLPVGLGAIAVDATEEDFVRSFISAMPQDGDGRFQFLLRPINVRGKELGKEITLNISEHHAVLRNQRQRNGNNPFGDPFGQPTNGRGDVIVQGNDSGAYYAEEMGRMFEAAVEARDEQTKLLQSQLERERAELRDAEKQRAEERVSAAERSASVVEKMTEKLMSTDRIRADEAMAAQKEQSQLVMSTLTTVFTQQQEASRQAAERQRQLDLDKQAQDREFYARQRQEVELRREREAREAEERRRHDREEYERKIEREKLEFERRAQQEKAELEFRREQMREERERHRQEIEERRRQDQMEWEKRQAMEREERERRERLDRERWEREKLEAQQRMEREKLEFERRRDEERRRDQEREEGRRQDMMFQQKQAELAAERDRQHAERMMEMSRLEREAQREAGLAREKLERESREAAERERERRMNLQVKEMELQRERDREHAERMVRLQQSQNSGGGLGAIGELLGMDTPEVLGKIFGKDEDGKWSDAIPKVLGGIGEVAKVVLSGQAGAPPGAPQRHGRRRVQPQSPPPAPAGKTEQQPEGGERMLAIQTPEGVKLIPESALDEMNLDQLQRMTEGAGERVPVGGLADQPFRPEGMAEGDAQETTAPSMMQKASAVDTMARAQAANISLQDQKKARKAIRDLASKLEKSSEDDWVGHVMAALGDTPVMFDYLNAVTVYAALAEAKVKEDLGERIVAALRTSDLVPEGALIFTDDDLRAAAQRAAEEAAAQPEETATAEEATDGGEA